MDEDCQSEGRMKWKRKRRWKKRNLMATFTQKNRISAGVFYFIVNDVYANWRCKLNICISAGNITAAINRMKVTQFGA